MQRDPRPTSRCSQGIWDSVWGSVAPPEARETAGLTGFRFPTFCISARTHRAKTVRDLEAWQQTCEHAQEAGRQAASPPHARAVNQMNLPSSSFKVLISQLLFRKDSEPLQG